MIDEADRRGRVLMVGHTFVYTGDMQKMRELVKRGDLGRRLLLRFDAHQPGALPARRQRPMGPGRSRSVDHGCRLAGSSQSAVSATGIAHVAGSVRRTLRT